MKVNSTVALTFTLLALMLGAGVFTATWGYAIGREALKGITQPDSRPTNKGTAKNSSGREELVILKEEDIIKSVKEKINATGRAGSASTNSNTSAAPPAKSEKSVATVTTAKLPILTRSNDVAMEVTGIRKQGDSMLLDVAMKNDGSQPVKFLYSFLNVTDDKGRLIVAETTGLPSELPAKSDRLSGTISIPTSMLDDAQKLSIQLSDYPDQKLQLKMADIPIK
ncbi:MAG: hypothetical protein J0L70_04995 [Leptolyngbya sp. UWPOB_LEPTO1]|uniref:hypothetical protein n=1 Tax=Leptolyngbya sp. UWPOB_LEPTO1 TaxID=2815653 RepID=UPI001AC2EE77|nr:hypothetical protein [Leptolyngbya sp. UWPOB_LEPTO1]MBN8559857.1 hypothetical protein [Leptolyngbya sp. UWPOB_LEPTO1]